MTLTEDSCAVAAMNLAVGMKALLQPHSGQTGWVTITDVSHVFVPPITPFVRIDYIDAKGVEAWFIAGFEARQQVLSSTQIPA